MFTKCAVFFVVFACIFSFSIIPAHAIVNPLSVPNNKIGIHILDVSELPQAAQLINSGGGDWGYVTIPIQASDENLVKWQKFMDQCKKYHIIPIIRLATLDDYFNTEAWQTPTQNDIVDFAVFLNSLDWPTKNRYVIVYNEVNRGDEWGGQADPSGYAHLLSFAVTVFKSANPDFFVISAGLDNAAPDQGATFYNEYTYLAAMNQAVPGIFNQVDGIASHSYPNPGFSQAPDSSSLMGVGSFFHERSLIESMSTKPLPVFITETGWSSSTIPPDTEVQYYNQTLQTIWDDPDIVAVTPFLLNAGAGPFAQFSFIDANGNKTKQYKYIASLQKTKGKPVLAPVVLGTSTKLASTIPLTIKDFHGFKFRQKPISLTKVSEGIFDYLINR